MLFLVWLAVHYYFSNHSKPNLFGQGLPHLLFLLMEVVVMVVVDKKVHGQKVGPVRSMVVTGVLLLEEMDLMLVEVVQDIMVDQVLDI